MPKRVLLDCDHDDSFEDREIKKSKVKKIPMNYDGLLSLIVTSNIENVVIDFDQTLTNIHTEGEWSKSLDDLLWFIRKPWYNFINQLQLNKINVGIVSFSSQQNLIKNVAASISPTIGVAAFPPREIRVISSKLPHINTLIREGSLTILIDDNLGVIRETMKTRNIIGVYFNGESFYIVD